MTAAIYARKSTDQAVADEAKSVTRQICHAREYGARKGWTVDEAHVYVDDGISGAEFARRPGFLRLMNALKPQPAFRILIMSEESRLGREAIETAYALKQLVAAGVRVFFYLEDRERTLDSPTDKIMMSLTAFADELERERARQRTYDALLRKARAGHVTGGRLFGYGNVAIVGAAGTRSHVEREVIETEAAVIRRIFELSAAGQGMKAIAKTLNAAGVPSPRAQQGRSQSWAPSSVRAVLFHDAYRGVITWNKTKKRDRWGVKNQAGKPASEWLEVPAPALRIVTDEVWRAAHIRLEAARAIYVKPGQPPFGRPPLGNPSKYLLTNLALCGCCGGPLRVRSRKGSGSLRAMFYGCAAYHERGKTVCANKADVPMIEADDIVIEALLDDVLDAQLLVDAVDEALQLVADEQSQDRVPGLEAEIEHVEGERARLVAAVASGGSLEALVAALKAREERLGDLRRQVNAARAEKRVSSFDHATTRRELLTLAGDWRKVLATDPLNARPIVSTLLDGRLTITPTGTPKQWELEGRGTLIGLFSGQIFPSVIRPHRDSNPGFSLERAAS
jgi:site-specific DNA recombinase